MIIRVSSRWDAAAACDREVSHLISIQNPDADVSDLRPDSIRPENHLLLLFEDLTDPEDAVGPKDHHVRELIEWVTALDRSRLRGLVVHCDAGVSRSTASAWLALVVLEPETTPEVHLEPVAKCASSTYCWPSDLVTALGDRILGLDGSLVGILHKWKTNYRSLEW